MTEPDVGVLAQQVADAVRSVPDVADLHAGVLGEVATYLPGHRVPGVRLLDDGCELHVTTRGTRPLRETVVAVRAAVRPLVVPTLGGRVDVVVEDVLG